MRAIFTLVMVLVAGAPSLLAEAQETGRLTSTSTARSPARPTPRTTRVRTSSAASARSVRVQERRRRRRAAAARRRARRRRVEKPPPPPAPAFEPMGPPLPPDAGVIDAGESADAGEARSTPRERGPLIEPVQQVWEGLGDTVSVFVPTARLRSLTDPLILLLLIGLGMLVSTGAARLRPRLAEQGILPRLIGFLHVAGRFAALVLAGILLVRAAPDWLRPALPWVLLAAAVAVGWSARDLLPDLLAGGVLLSERRIRPGAFIQGGGFAGTVDQMGIRATWLRDDVGRRVSVPNRRLLTGPVVISPGRDADYRTRVRLPGAPPSEAARPAIVAAVVCSPLVPVGATPEVLQDVDDPSLWHIRVRLRRRNDGPRFDGELRGRVLAFVAAEQARGSARTREAPGERAPSHRGHDRAHGGRTDA